MTPASVSFRPILIKHKIYFDLRRSITVVGKFHKTKSGSIHNLIHNLVFKTDCFLRVGIAYYFSLDFK